MGWRLKATPRYRCSTRVISFPTSMDQSPRLRRHVCRCTSDCANVGSYLVSRGRDLNATDDPSLTMLLDDWQEGDGAAYGAVFSQAYVELRRIARQRIHAMGSDVTLSPTELVHEAVLRVMGTELHWKDRNHFFASLSLYMRAVLVDRARARASLKRGGGATHLALSQVDFAGDSGSLDLLALDSALQRLEELDPRCGSVLHLTCFAGLKRQQIAEVLNVSVQIVDRELRFAKSWLTSHLHERAQQ